MPRYPVMFKLPKNYLSMGVRDWAGLLMELVRGTSTSGKYPPYFPDVDMWLFGGPNTWFAEMLNLTHSKI
jgi:hypothetical protein